MKNRQDLVSSFKYAFSGIRKLWDERNARIHFLAAFLVILAGLYFDISNLEWMIIILTIGIVIAAEAFNTAIETLTDLVSPEINDQAGKVKDIAAGAVLVTAIAALIVGILVFGPRVYGLIS